MIHVEKIGNLGTSIKMKGRLPEILSDLEITIRLLKKAISKKWGKKASKEIMEMLFRESMLSQEERDSELDDLKDILSSDKDLASDLNEYIRKMFEK